MSDSAAIPADALAALKRGNKIEAIKLTRAATGMGLKEAKDAVESALRQDATLQQAYETAKPAGLGLPQLALIAIVIALVMYWLLT